jgi:4-hydroxy-3-polyprenylbenzoate decarboxylase
MRKKRYIVALSGASGAVYGRRMLEVLASTGQEIHFTLSEAARQVIRHELSIDLEHARPEEIKRALVGAAGHRLHYHDVRNLGAPISSGSFVTAGMAIVPCSMGTIGRIASGVSMNLIDRAADVCLKERRRLIVVPRETPLSEIHLENMLRLTRAGAIVLPASPGFYSGVECVERLVDFVVGRALDHWGIEHDLTRRYGESPVAESLREE